MRERILELRSARWRALGLAATSAALAGCAAEGPDPAVCDLLAAASELTAVDGEPGERDVDKGLMLKNGLSANALSANALTPNGFSVNGLGVNGLGLNGSRLDELELLRYVARCALPVDQHLIVSEGGTSERLVGALGLAPEWPARDVSAEEERWVSACLLAHVNAFGEEVPISLRGSGRIAADATERAAFSLHEGAFFGSLASGQRFSCSAEPPASALALSHDRAARVCTDPGASCSIEALGACDDLCDDHDDVHGYSRCHAGGEVHTAVVNVHLREDAALAACGLPAE